jgi:large repetitive protein
MWFVLSLGRLVCRLALAIPLFFAFDGANRGPAAYAAGASPTLQLTPSTPVRVPINTVLTPPITAKVTQTDAQGRTTPVVNVDVSFTAPSTGASGTFGTGKLASATSKTDAAGVATPPSFTTNHTLGTYNVTVTTAGATTAAISITNTENAALAESINWVGNPGLVFINHVLQPPLAVQVLNSLGQPLVGTSVTFQAPSSGPSGTFADSHTTRTTAVTNPSGVATAADFTANRVGGDPYPVTATVDASLTTSGGALSNFVTLTNVNDPGTEPSNVFVLAGANQQASVLSTFKTNLQVKVQDGFQLPLEVAAVVFTTPSTGASGTFAGGSRSFSVLTDASGQALAPTLTANGSVGLYAVSVSASLNGVSVSTSLTLTNTRVATTTSLVASPASSSVYGQPVNLSAALQPASGTLVPAAGVQFSNGSGVIPTCSLVTPLNGVATCPINGLTAGHYTFTAAYAGDTVSDSSTSPPLAYTVNQADTKVTVDSSAAGSVAVGGMVTFTAHVSPIAPGAGTPTGSVVFTASDGTSPGGGAAVPLVNGSGQVITTLSQAGAPVITAAYAGDANFKSGSGTLTQSVTRPVGFLGFGDVTRGTISAQVNHPFESISIYVLDDLRNRLPGVTVTFSTPASGPSATFDDTHTNVTTAVSDAQGFVRPAQFTANGLEGNYRLSATVGGTQTASGNPMTIGFTLRNKLDDPNAQTLIYLGLFGGQTTVLTPFNEHLGAEVFDGNGHALVGARVVFSAPTSGASGTFPDGSTSYVTTVDSNANTSAPTLTANGIVGTYEVVITVTRSDGISDSTSLPFTNVQVGTTTTLDIAPAGGASMDQSVVLRAAIKPLAGALVPAAAVDFTRDGAPIASCLAVVPVAGVATCTLNQLDIGSYSFGASYAGDASSAASAAPPVAYSVHVPDPTVVVVPTATATFTPTPTFTPTSTPTPVALPEIEPVTEVPVVAPVSAVDPPQVSVAPPSPTPTATSAPRSSPAGGGGGGGGSHRPVPTPVLVHSSGGGGGGGGGASLPSSGFPNEAPVVTPPEPNLVAFSEADPSIVAEPDPATIAEPEAEPEPATTFANLSIGLIQADPLVPGQSAQLTFLLLNPGGLDASPDLLVQDLLPDGLAFNSVLSDGWNCGSDAGQPLTCSLPAPMAAGTQTTLQLVVDVTAVDTSAPLVNLASLSSPSLDPSLPPPTSVDALVFQRQPEIVDASAPPEPDAGAAETSSVDQVDPTGES